jgi:hypothetical protein
LPGVGRAEALFEQPQPILKRDGGAREGDAEEGCPDRYLPLNEEKHSQPLFANPG